MINTYSKYGADKSTTRLKDRTPIIGILLVLAGALIVGRLFYIQVIKHETYKSAAVAEQLKKLIIPAERGSISILDGEKVLPAVLNETKYLIFADPSFVRNPHVTATKLQPLLDLEVNELEKKLSISSRYVELKNKLDEKTKNKISALKLPGIVAKKQKFRSYPEIAFASQVLGFVNYDGLGQYGVEGYLNEELNGTPGLLKAVTDVRGVPLAGNTENVVKRPIDGQDITLTIDTTMQLVAEAAIQNGVETTRSTGGSVVILDASSGAVKAMANWPSYDPSNYDKVEDQNLYKNKSVTDALEVGSIMKLMTMSAALDLGVISKDGSYLDKGYEEADGYRVKNAISYGERTFSIFDILKYSLNTGAVHVLKQMNGGGLNERTRILWHGYLTEHYMFGRQTGIEQSGEGKGIVPDPTDGHGLNIQYANTAFGQGITVTLVQYAAALCALVNGGTYYQPSLIYSTTSPGEVIKTNKPKVVATNIISESASNDIVDLMKQYAKQNNPETARAGFSIGGKTGTAQIPAASGGYREDAFIGTYAGFVGGGRPEYVVVLRVDEPKNGGFAGSNAARPIFTEIANNLMDVLPFTRSL